jgi:hypothetical protein
MSEEELDDQAKVPTDAQMIQYWDSLPSRQQRELLKRAREEAEKDGKGADSRAVAQYLAHRMFTTLLADTILQESVDKGETIIRSVVRPDGTVQQWCRGAKHGPPEMRPPATENN